MIDPVNILLLLSLIGCLIYIYWLHQTEKKSKSKPQKENAKRQEETDDNMSFLKSDYDTSVFSKGTDSNFMSDTNSLFNMEMV